MTKGSCLCGGVQFEVAEFSSDIFKCHCSKCRKAFGGASSAAALTTEDNFSWLKGSELANQFVTESGYRSVFCKNCGSIIPQHLNDYKMFWVPAGLLDGDPGIVLTKHLHTNSKAAWEILDEQVERLEEGLEL